MTPQELITRLALARSAQEVAALLDAAYRQGITPDEIVTAFLQLDEARHLN